VTTTTEVQPTPTTPETIEVIGPITAKGVGYADWNDEINPWGPVVCQICHKDVRDGEAIYRSTELYQDQELDAQRVRHEGCNETAPDPWRTGKRRMKMRVRFARGTGGSMHMTTVPEYLRRTFTQGQWSADCPVCLSDAYSTQYRPSFRAALDYADRHARSHGIHEVSSR